MERRQSELSVLAGALTRCCSGWAFYPMYVFISGGWTARAASEKKTEPKRDHVDRGLPINARKYGQQKLIQAVGAAELFFLLSFCERTACEFDILHLHHGRKDSRGQRKEIYMPKGKHHRPHMHA